TPPPATGRYTVEPRLDPLSGRDAYVDGFELYTNDNFGADLGIMTGVRKRGSSSAPRLGFVAFPLEQLPPGAEIESATLELSSDPRPLEFALEVYRVLGPWVEGANGLDDSLDGVAWGEGPQPLNDPGFARPTLEARPLSRFDGAPVPARWDVTAAARAWLADPASNHGLCVAPTLSEAEVAELEDGSHYRSFRSRDSSSTRERPCLRVTYRGAAPRAPEPYAVRLAAHRAETAAALRAASRLAPDARLTRITELLVAVPSDVELRCARIRTLLELGRFEDAIHECTALERTHSAPYPPVAMEAAAQILREPRLAAEVRRADKLWLVWKTYWSLLDAEHVPVEVHPPRDFRLSALQTRIMVYDEFELVVEHYRRGLALWPGARELQEEFAALPELCLQIARALREQPATVERGRRVAAEALRALPCTLVQARELEQLAR
ncbi:MAG: DNRLRE domain-containing protein, partial [Planctomycetes bacterium]|nr:DNRLRE domain-containing protein [Planctomycetota bacterium]